MEPFLWGGWFGDVDEGAYHLQAGAEYGDGLAGSGKGDLTDG